MDWHLRWGILEKKLIKKSRILSGKRTKNRMTGLGPVDYVSPPPLYGVSSDFWLADFLLDLTNMVEYSGTPIYDSFSDFLRWALIHSPTPSDESLSISTPDHHGLCRRLLGFLSEFLGLYRRTQIVPIITRGCQHHHCPLDRSFAVLYTPRTWNDLYDS